MSLKILVIVVPCPRSKALANDCPTAMHIYMHVSPFINIDQLGRTVLTYAKSFVKIQLHLAKILCF